MANRVVSGFKGFLRLDSSSSDLMQAETDVIQVGRSDSCRFPTCFKLFFERIQSSCSWPELGRKTTEASLFDLFSDSETHLDLSRFPTCTEKKPLTPYEFLI